MNAACDSVRLPGHSQPNPSRGRSLAVRQRRVIA